MGNATVVTKELLSMFFHSFLGFSSTFSGVSSSSSGWSRALLRTWEEAGYGYRIGRVCSC